MQVQDPADAEDGDDDNQDPADAEDGDDDYQDPADAADAEDRSAIEQRVEEHMQEWHRQQLEIAYKQLKAKDKELEAKDKELKRLREEGEAKDAELEELRAFQRRRESVEATLPSTRDWTLAEAYVLTPNNSKALVDVVGEQYKKLGDDTIFIVNAKDSSLLVHDPQHGYVSAGPVLSDALDSLLIEVRKSVGAVKIDEDDQEDIEPRMISNLKNPGTLASKITEVQITTALVLYLRRVPTINVLSLDAQLGLFNLRGAKVASYDHVTGWLSLVPRDPKLHHVHRSSGVDGAWLEDALSAEQQQQYDAFVSNKLNRWIIEPDARGYVLCATGVALFGGDTTRIKSSLLLIGAPDQAKSSLLNTLVSAGGWEEGRAGQSAGGDASAIFYSCSGADPNALLAKSSKDKLRNGMLAAANGTRLCQFNEFETSQDPWPGVKRLSNMEPQPITTSKASGSTSVHRIETPYAMLSCNLEKRPPAPPDDVKTKVAVITPAMLGSFVDTGADGEKTFLKVTRFDSSDDAVRLCPQLSNHRTPPPCTPRCACADPAPHAPLPCITGPDAARDVAGAEGARREAPQRAVRPRAPHA